jgi:hypothetical protein
MDFIGMLDETNSIRVSVLAALTSLLPVNLNDIATGCSIFMSESTLLDLAVQTVVQGKSGGKQVKVEGKGVVLLSLLSPEFPDNF